MNSQSSRRNILGTKEITKATKNTTKKDYKKRFRTDSARILSIPRGIRTESAHSVRNTRGSVKYCQEQHSQNVTREGYPRCNKTLVMGVEMADFSCWMLHSTEAELCDCFKISEKSGDSCRAKGIGHGSPHGSGGCCDEISDVQGTSELNFAIGH